MVGQLGERGTRRWLRPRRRRAGARPLGFCVRRRHPRRREPRRWAAAAAAAAQASGGPTPANSAATRAAGSSSRRGRRRGGRGRRSTRRAGGGAGLLRVVVGDARRAARRRRRSGWWPSITSERVRKESRRDRAARASAQPRRHLIVRGRVGRGAARGPCAQLAVPCCNIWHSTPHAMRRRTRRIGHDDEIYDGIADEKLRRRRVLCAAAVSAHRRNGAEPDSRHRARDAAIHARRVRCIRGSMPSSPSSPTSSTT